MRHTRGRGLAWSLVSGLRVFTAEEDMKPVSPPAGNTLREIVVADPSMLELIETAQSMARLKAAVLITGETGVGKELVARIIHEHSTRSARPWVDLNCAALPEHLVESELFGYERGAFSGADNTKPGLFEIAHGGTLFLDEIGDLDPKIQVKLLRVLDGIPYYRLGGSRKISVDVRVLAATNRDLKRAVREGSFRGDLYHRISELQVEVPPLRERPEDIIALAQHFLERYRPEARFTPQALQSLLQFEWQGNVRELRNLVLKLAIVSSHAEISVQDVQRYLGEPSSHASPPAAPVPPEITSMAEMERHMIARALEMTGGNQRLAAAQLGMPRRTFCRKLSEMHITLDDRHHGTRRKAEESPPSRRRELQVPISITTKAGRCFAAASRNLSRGGLGLQVQPPLAVDERLNIAFTLPGSRRRLQVQGVVVWSQPDGAAGIRFVEMSDSKIEVLNRWLGGSRPIPASEETELQQHEPPSAADVPFLQ
jgi:DNA-binding NtrC family response regulator/Tfp pilus assembly protein PilZ